MPKRIAKTLWRHKWKTLIALLVIVPIGLFATSASRPKQPEYVTAQAKRGDLVQTVEAVGTVTSDRDLELQFKSSGIVSDVYVKVGDTVRPGQRLATLRAGSLSASVASAAASVREAEAQLRALKEGTRPEDLAVSEATVENRRAALEAARTNYNVASESLKSAQLQLDSLKSEASTKLQGQVQLAVSTVSEKLARAEQGLLVIDDVFADNEVADAVRYDQAGMNAIMKQKNTVYDHLVELRGRDTPTEYQDVLLLMTEIRSTMNDAVTVLDSAYRVVANLPITTYLSASDRETHKASLASEKNAVLSAQSSLETSASALQDAAAGYDTRIATQEASIISAKGAMEKAQSDIRTYEASLAIDVAQLNLKKAGARQADLDAAVARLRQAQATLARASADLADTVITAPVAGSVTKVNVKPGELSPLEPAITLLGTSPYRVEMFVSEIDIPKVQYTQTGSIELDAFKDIHMKLRASEIDSAPTDVSGVSKYKITLDFVHPHDEVKIGMTGDVEIITGMRSDVISVPLRSVLQDGEGNKFVRVLRPNGSVEDRTVETGMEDAAGNVEITTGLEEDETVVVLQKTS